MIQESKLGQFISTLKPLEFKDWEAFMNSPFFNTNKNVVKLWKIIKPHHPELIHPSLTKEKIYKRIFKDDYRDLKMRKLLSATVKLLEKYWVHTRLEKDKHQYESSLADCYYDQALYDQFEKSYRNQIAAIEKKPFKTAVELQQLINAYHQLSFNLSPSKKNLNQVDIEASNQYLWDYAQQQSLFYTADFNNKKTLYDIAIPEFIQQLNEDLLNKKNAPFEQKSLAFIYQQVNKMLLTTGLEALQIFEALESLLRNNFKALDEVTNYWLLSHLINFSIRKERADAKHHRHITLLKFGITHQLLLFKGKMSTIQFSNTVYRLCLLKEFELAQQFIDTYKTFLAPKKAAIIIDLTKAYISFFTEDYKESYCQLSSFYFEESILFEVGRRGLLLRSTFECYLMDATFESILATSLNNYKQYLFNKTQLSEIKRQPYLNFIRSVELLFKWMTHKDRSLDELKKIQVITEELRPLPKPAKDWLLAHIDKLM